MNEPLSVLAADASSCTKCRLSESRTQVVFGVGNPDADLMFIGEAPGFHEDKQGEPFVGAAGQLLTRMLTELIGVGRDDVYICNILKCRPPGNRDPQDDEIETCTPWLIEQISLIQPRVIVTLGNFATKFVLNTRQGITRMRGAVYPWHGRRVIPTFHPAAILRGGGEGSRQFAEFREDFELIRDTLAEPDRPETPPAQAMRAPEAPPDEHLRARVPVATAATSPDPSPRPGAEAVPEGQLELF